MLVHGINFILAQDDDGPGRFIGFLVVAAIIGFNALVGWIKKQQEKSHREKVRQQLEKSSAPQPPPPVLQRQPQRRQRPPMPARVQPQPPRQRPAKRQPQRQQVRAHQEPVIAVEQVQVAPAPSPPPTVAQSPSARAPIAANARAISTWLRPATLQRQFVLTEVLQPPVALRPPRS